MRRIERERYGAGQREVRRLCLRGAQRLATDSCPSLLPLPLSAHCLTSCKFLSLIDRSIDRVCAPALLAMESDNKQLHNADNRSYIVR